MGRTGNANTETLCPSPAARDQKIRRKLQKKLMTLRFLETPTEQAEFIIELIQQAAPAKSSLLHSVSRRTQEATVIAALGEHAPMLLELTTDPDDAILTQLRRTRRPLPVASPKTDERCLAERWSVLAPQKYILAIPFVCEHRLLGFVELTDPEHKCFSRGQVKTVEDIGTVWAALLSA